MVIGEHILKIFLKIWNFQILWDTPHPPAGKFQIFLKDFFWPLPLQRICGQFSTFPALPVNLSCKNPPLQLYLLWHHRLHQWSLDKNINLKNITSLKRQDYICSVHDSDKFSWKQFHEHFLKQTLSITWCYEQISWFAVASEHAELRNNQPEIRIILCQPIRSEYVPEEQCLTSPLHKSVCHLQPQQ